MTYQYLFAIVFYAIFDAAVDLRENFIQVPTQS